MTKLSLLLLVWATSLSCAAAEPQCANPVDTVKQSPLQNAAGIVHHFWEVGRDKRSDEHIKTLYLFFTNGDYAAIQHKYCSMYNFEIVYFRSGQADKLDAAGIAKLVTGLYERYAAKKVTFKQPLADVIVASLTARGFSDDKDIRAGLPDGNADYPNKRVEYSIRYNSLYRSTSIYSSATTFYLGIGGAH